MRFTSYRLQSGTWLCFCIVTRWRPLYDRLNRLLSGMEGLAHWTIVTQEEWDGVTARTAPSRERVATYGNRPDGTPKGAGYYGEIQNPYTPGEYSTELTIGVTVAGKPMDIPVIVPGLTQHELRAVLQAKDPKAFPESVILKAVAHAKARMQQGKSPYADPGEYHPLPKD